MRFDRIVIFVLALPLWACTGGQATVAAPSEGETHYDVMDFTRPLDLAALPSGWRHRKFLRVEPMQISFVSKAQRAAIGLQTHGSASMLYRDVNISLDKHGLLTWGWFVEQPVVSELDETTAEWCSIDRGGAVLRH